MLLSMPSFSLVLNFTPHGSTHRDEPLAFCAANISSGNTDESCAIVRLACLQGNRPPRFQFAQVCDLKITDFYKTILILMNIARYGYLLPSLFERLGHVSLIAEIPTTLIITIALHEFIPLEYRA